MSLERIDAKSLLLLVSGFLMLLLSACETPAVGAPCLPEQIPTGGYSDTEAYIESSSVQCETRVCLVYRLRGDPSEGCVPSTSTCDPATDEDCEQGTICADQTETEKRVYCSCRCNSGDTGFAECECPDGFSCVNVLEQGGPGVRGGYCVRNGTFTNAR